MIALRNAANLLPSEANATYITIHQHQNISVIKTLQKTAAAKITRTSRIYISSQTRKVCVYEMPPEDSCRGVVHGIDAGTPTSELMANLCAPGTDIINAQMI